LDPASGLHAISPPPFGGGRGPERLWGHLMAASGVRGSGGCLESDRGVEAEAH
jgi:hypothetical protein